MAKKGKQECTSNQVTAVSVHSGVSARRLPVTLSSRPGAIMTVSDHRQKAGLPHLGILAARSTSSHSNGEKMPAQTPQLHPNRTTPGRMRLRSGLRAGAPGDPCDCQQYADSGLYSCNDIYGEPLDSLMEEDDIAVYSGWCLEAGNQY